MTTTATLFQGGLSSSSWRVRIALALKGIAYETVFVDVAVGAQFQPEYGTVAPMHQVPCLEIDGLRLYQTVAIVEYLDETRPAPRLYPADPAGRAAVRAMVEVVNSGVQPLHNTPVRQFVASRYGVGTAGADAWCQHWIERFLGDFDRLVAGTRGRYAFGDSVTAVDVFLYPQLLALPRFGVDPTRFETLHSVVQALGELPAFAGSHPNTP